MRIREDLCHAQVNGSCGADDAPATLRVLARALVSSSCAAGTMTVTEPSVTQPRQCHNCWSSGCSSRHFLLKPCVWGHVLILALCWLSLSPTPIPWGNWHPQSSGSGFPALTHFRGVPGRCGKPQSGPQALEGLEAHPTGGQAPRAGLPRLVTPGHEGRRAP